MTGPVRSPPLARDLGPALHHDGGAPAAAGTDGRGRGPAGAGGAGRRPSGAGFLLAQVGALGTRLFAARLTPLGMTPVQSGLIRAIARDPGQSQNALAEHLGLRPSRLVVLIDELEQAGLAERRPHVTDRRQRAVHLTEDGHAAMSELTLAAADHEDELCRSLSTEDRHRLRELLARIADDHGITPRVHPGTGGAERGR